MPQYRQSKSQKRSKSQSKNGGRRKKQTMRKLRRGRKSRKVMRGGAIIQSSDELNQKLQSRPDIKTKLISAFSLLADATAKDIFNAVSTHYGDDTTINPIEVTARDGPIRSNPELVAFFETFK